MTIDPQALYVQLGRIVEAMPAMEGDWPVAEIQRWLAQAYALVEACGDAVETASFKRACERLHSSRLDVSETAAIDITLILHRRLAVAELNAPASAHGAFIAAGNSFDALTAVGKVLSAAKSDILIVDPYLDEKVLSDFAPMAAETISLRLLTDQLGMKPSLCPAAERWSQQYGSKRPMEAKVSPPRTLHDRVIVVDGSEAWILTQSLNAFAARSPASIVRSDEEVAQLKIAYYTSAWAAAKALK